MTTLTQVKRDRFPERYAKKDARTRIYRALYGYHPSRTKDPKGRPEDNPDRYLPEQWSYVDAKHVCEVFMDMAQFPIERRTKLAKRLEALKSIKR